MRISISQKARNILALLAIVVVYTILRFALWGYGLPALARELQAHPSSSLLLLSLYNPFFILLWVISLGLGISLHKQQLRWKQIWEGSRWMPRIFGLSILVMIGITVLSSYNYPLNQGFWLDRILILLLGIGCFLRPAYLPSFLLASTLFRAQMYVPFFWVYPYQYRLFFDLFVLLALFLAFRRSLKLSLSPIVFLWICIHLGHYFHSGLGKVWLSPHGWEWVTENELFLLPLNAQMRGWWMGYSEAMRTGISLFFAKGQVPLQIGILLAEMGVIVFWANRKLAIGLLTALTLMHLGIAWVVGIFFWSWAIINVLLIALLIQEAKQWASLFSLRYGLGGSLLIVSALVYAQAAQLAWFESRIQWYTDIIVEDANGQEWYVDKNELRPYHYSFVHDIGLFAIPETLFNFNGYSSLRYNELMALRQSPVEDLEGVRRKWGKWYYREDAAQLYEGFIRAYFTHRNQAPPLAHWLQYLDQVPGQLYMFQYPPYKRFQWDREVVRVKVQFREQFYSGNKHHVTRDRIIMDIALKP